MAASPELQAKGDAARAHVQARPAVGTYHRTGLHITHFTLLLLPPTTYRRAPPSGLTIERACYLRITHFTLLLLPPTTYQLLLQASFSLEAFGRQLETYLVQALGGRARTD